MKLRTLPLAALAAVAVLVPATAVVPAYASPPAAGDVPGVALNSPTAGHITGTVTSGQPYVAVRLASVVPTTVVTMVNGSGTFDLETWGYHNYNTGILTVEARACDGASAAATCSDAQTSGVEFTPVDVVPQVTGFADSTLGPDDPDPSLTISDPDGGGVLNAFWPGHGCNSNTLMNRNGTTQLNVCGDGGSNVYLQRCSSADLLICAPIDTGAVNLSLQVHRTLHVSEEPAKAITQVRANSSFYLYTDNVGTYQLTWHLRKLVGDVPVDVPGTGGTASGTLSATPGSSFTAPVTIPGAGLEDGQYVVAGTITVHTPSDPGYDYGTYVDVPLPEDHPFTVDTTGPAVSSITASPTKIYPRIASNATYKSSTKITVTHAAGEEIHSFLIYRKTTGELVRTVTPSSYGTTHASVIWNGRSRSNTGPAVPSGTYVIKVRDLDKNISSTVGQVTVSGYRLIAKTWSHTYTPVSTLADSYVGKCSTLRKPSLRGWYNSLGYYANTRCSSQTSRYSLVSTLHAIYLPNAAVYSDIKVSVYGGAAKAKPGSRAVIRYLRTDGDWAYESAVSSTLGSHNGQHLTTTNVVFKDHSFAWGLYTGFGYRYDVKSFTVVLHYKVLGS